MAQWSELQLNLMESILEKLDLADHARFASVCSSWRSVAINNYPPINKPLYFVLSHAPENLVCPFITSFIPSWMEAKFIGALDGWLVILVDRRDLFLLNKGFNSIIPLPPPPKDVKNSLLCKAVLSSPPLSSSCECTVVIKHCARGGLYSCRVGLDMSFTEIFRSSIGVHDILFYKGRLYVLCDSNTIAIFNHLLVHLGDITVPRCGLTRLLISGNKLLISGNKLFVVMGSLDSSLVFKVQRKKSGVVQVNNIDDKFLVLNNFCSVSITANEHKEFRRNYYDKISDTYVLDMGEDPYEASMGAPWPLFFFMFRGFLIKNEMSKRP